jgi:hypothetical protein
MAATFFFCTRQHRLDVFVILAGERLGRQDDLVFGIDQGLGVVALDHAVRGGHLHRFIIHSVALDLFAIAALLGFLLLEEFIEPLDLPLEASFAFLLPLHNHLRLFVRLGMFGHHAL